MYEIAFEIKQLCWKKWMGHNQLQYKGVSAIITAYIYIYTGLKKHGKDYGGVKEGVGVIKEGYMEVVTFDLDLEG